jgi:hypothetical protein
MQKSNYKNSLQNIQLNVNLHRIVVSFRFLRALMNAEGTRITLTRP